MLATPHQRRAACASIPTATTPAQNAPRCCDMPGRDSQAPVSGSKRNVEDSEGPPQPNTCQPPQTYMRPAMTPPACNSHNRGMDEQQYQVPSSGSKRSALDSGIAPVVPPHTYRQPRRTTAIAQARGDSIGGTVFHSPLTKQNCSTELYVTLVGSWSWLFGRLNPPQTRS